MWNRSSLLSFSCVTWSLPTVNRRRLASPAGQPKNLLNGLRSRAASETLPARGGEEPQSRRSLEKISACEKPQAYAIKHNFHEICKYIISHSISFNFQASQLAYRTNDTTSLVKMTCSHSRHRNVPSQTQSMAGIRPQVHYPTLFMAFQGKDRPPLENLRRKTPCRRRLSPKCEARWQRV